MSKFNKAVLAAFLWVAAHEGANAADFVPPAQEVVPVPPAVLSGWYLRGDIGFSNQTVDSLDNKLYDAYDSVDTVTKEFDGAPFAGLGVGYRWNKWLRLDATAEYRSASDFTGLDIGEIGPDLVPNNYTATKSEWVGLLNAYVDLGSWRGLSPFIGAGLGATRNTISDFTDVGVTVDSVAFGDDESVWNFAWALYAGLGLEVTPAVTMEIAYRYLHLGDAESGDLVTFDGANTTPDNPMIFEDLASHDIRVGLRYQLQ